MAWKTPGVYFTEIDNTEYQNPAAEINTTVAIIGFAKKGPIGVPTEITTYNDYKSTFGTPIDGQYAGLALRNVLSAGGTVLFTRVADTTIASKSCIVLKNGKEATDGMLVINKTSDITTDMVGYELSSVYSGTLKTVSGEEKHIIVRTPAEGKLKLSKMFEQFQNSLTDTAGYDEFKVSKEIRTSSYRSFNISLSAEDTNGDEFSKEDYGPFFIKVPGNDSDGGAISNTKDRLDTIFSSMKTNAYQKFYLIGAYDNYSNKVYDPSGDENGDPDAATATSYVLGLGGEKNKKFQLVLTTKNSNGETSKVPMSVEFSGEADSSSDSYYITMEDIASALTKAFEAKNQNIYVKYCYTDVKDDESCPNVLSDLLTSNEASPFFLFVSMDEDIVSFDITPYIDSESKIDNKTLFVPVAQENHPYNSEILIDLVNNNDSDNKTTCFTTVTGTAGNYSLSNILLADGNSATANESATSASLLDNNSNYKCLFLAKKECVEQKEELEANIINVEHEEKTSSFKFVFNCGSEYKYKGSKVEITKTKFGSFLFEDETAENNLYLKTDNSYSIGSHLATFVGENGIDSSVKTKLIDGQICLFEEGNTIPGDFETNDTSISGYLPLSDLIGEVVSEETYTSNSYTLEDTCVISKEGSPALDASKQDMVIFTAREYGEGTTDIGMIIGTSTSPIDGTETHYIRTLVNGTVKEEWEDVSYEPSAENYFVNLINEEPENDGSSYVKVSVIKKDTSKTAIGINDTEFYTGDDDIPVYLGKPLSSESVNRLEANAKESEYEKYDYVVGNNGVPEDTTDLFVDAMDTLNSGLSNKDLYTWHILITPDNIGEEVQDAAINLVEFMEDAIYIADPPQGLSRDKVIKWHNGKYIRGSALQSNYACTYWPWCKLYDSTAGKYVWAMPSVVMAAQFCKTDNWYAPWYAPAGETCGLMSSVLDIEEYPNKNDRDQLYLDQNRINPFLKLKNGNILAFGEKTLQRKNSTLTKIHTRRMLIALKHDLRNAIKGFLFLPTMTENITKIRGIVTSIMEEVKVGGGVASYTVVCDETNNTTETLQQDILNIAVSCVPTGCIEQVEITFTLNKSAETVS